MRNTVVGVSITYLTTNNINYYKVDDYTHPLLLCLNIFGFTNSLVSNSVRRLVPLHTAHASKSELRIEWQTAKGELLQGRGSSVCS